MGVMANITEKTGVSIGLLIAVGVALTGVGGAFARLETLDEKVRANETRLAKLAEVDHETALRLVKFDSTLDNLNTTLRDVRGELERLRGTRTAGGTQR